MTDGSKGWQQMRHHFKIGETYENNKGPYTVIKISPPKMRVQFADGSLSTLDIEIQARIWDRILTERAIAREERDREVRAGRPTITFTGLVDSDFKDNVDGTTWRSRSGLGGLVYQQLSDMTGHEFISTAIYRLPQVFIHPPELPMENQPSGVKLPKFLVGLGPEAVFYGFYIEKADTPMGSDWYWPRFLDLLSDRTWQEKVEKVMADWELQWVLRFEVDKDAGDGIINQERKLIPAFSEGKEFPTFAAFLTFLKQLPPRQWCNLYIARRLDKSEAIRMKDKVSLPISRTLNALTPMYLHLLYHHLS